jgi:hypothetical protein
VALDFDDMLARIRVRLPHHDHQSFIERRKELVRRPFPLSCDVG